LDAETVIVGGDVIAGVELAGGFVAPQATEPPAAAEAVELGVAVLVGVPPVVTLVVVFFFVAWLMATKAMRATATTAMPMFRFRCRRRLAALVAASIRSRRPCFFR